MNVFELQKKLIAAARAKAPSDRVPYAFEKRVTALLGSRVAPRALDAWVAGLWRAAVSCVGVAMVCGAIALFTSASANSPGDNLSQSLDKTLLAAIDQSDQAQ
ncbi:MAG: hypothetical protein ACLQSR_08470 [Limisphaerales bacterium]